MTTEYASTQPVIVITSGEPAGIGPDIALALAQHHFNARIVILGDRDLITARAKQLGLSIDGLQIEHVPLRVPCVAGKLD